MLNLSILELISLLGLALADQRIGWSTDGGNCSAYADMSPFVKLGKNYYFVDGQSKVDFFAAAHICRTRESELASIENEREMRLLSDYLVRQRYQMTDWFWISANDISQEGKFHWMGTGKLVTYTRWSIGQPDNARGLDNCVIVYLNSGLFQMNDIDCTHRTYFICQRTTPEIVAHTVW